MRVAPFSASTTAVRWAAPSTLPSKAAEVSGPFGESKSSASGSFDQGFLVLIRNSRVPTVA